jgi:UDP-N-acetylglucosamine 2-epimerase (non-hydrolysing)
MKVSVIFGTRPEAIKMAPVVKALAQHPFLQGHVCVTGQHREMLDQVLDAFDIQPDVDLDLMTANQSLGQLTSRLMAHLDRYMAEEQPDLVLVQGDTATALAGAQTAFFHQIPIGHIEAGLRTHNLMSPWPEEANRVLIGRLANLHFAPTSLNLSNLQCEGIGDEHIHITANTVIDALLMAKERVLTEPPPIPGLSPQLLSPDGPPIVLITGHRRESFGPGFESICHAIARLARTFPYIHFVYPVHLNPRVREPVYRILQRENDNHPFENIHLIHPLPYLSFVRLMDRSMMILTDSGGIQEEAPSLGKPVLVMRDNTERTEAIDAGTVRLVGTETDTICQHACELLTNDEAYRQMAQANNPYGDGHATQAILEHCYYFLQSRQPNAPTIPQLPAHTLPATLL